MSEPHTLAERDDETVPCEICGTATPMTGTKLCDRCWELERRLADIPVPLLAHVFRARLYAWTTMVATTDASWLTGLIDDLCGRIRAYDGSFFTASAEHPADCPECLDSGWAIFNEGDPEGFKGELQACDCPLGLKLDEEELLRRATAAGFVVDPESFSVVEAPYKLGMVRAQSPFWALFPDGADGTVEPVHTIPMDDPDPVRAMARWGETNGWKILNLDGGTSFGTWRFML